VACAVAKLGGKAAFIGKVGRDAFGDFLERTLSGLSVDTGPCSAILPSRRRSPSSSSTGRKPVFQFLPQARPDLMLSPADIEAVDVSDCSIFHFVRSRSPANRRGARPSPP
jgi:fructokinase